MRTGADMAAPESSKEVEEQSMGKRLFLVDGSNLLFQMFFGMPARIKCTGESHSGDTRIYRRVIKNAPYG